VSEECNDGWLEVKRIVNEIPVLYRYRAAIDPKISFSDYPILVAIAWDFEDYDGPFKFEGSSEEHHNDLEESLSGLDGEENGFLILVMTGEGTKEWLWYVKDFESWMAKINESCSGKAVFPISISSYEEPEWGTYKKLIEMKSD
jgi:hypothetical protein